MAHPPGTPTDFDALRDRAPSRHPNAKDDLRERAREQRHNPKTVRKSVGESYRGCLVIKVLKGADLYRRIEGSWYGIVESVREADHQNRT